MLTGFEQRLRGAAELKPAALPDLDRLNRLAQIVLHAEAALALAAAVRGDLDTLAPSTRAIALPGWAMPAVWYRHALAQAAPLRAAFLAGSLGDADLLLAPCFPQGVPDRDAVTTSTRLRPARAGRAASPSRLRQFPGPAGAGAAGGPGRPQSPRQRAADRRAGQRGANAGLRPPVRPASLHVSATLTHGNHHVQDHRLPALSRFRVLDLSRVRGPTCVRILADFGADVIRIEPPAGVDPNEAMFAADRHGGDFQNLNRNKRSLTLNLKKPEGLAVLRSLVATADVVVENWRPDVKARLGLAYEDLRAINPRIILASISGFGQAGPYAGRPGLTRSSRAWAG